VAKVVKKSSLPVSDPRWTGGIELHEAMALKSLAAGSASPEQQKAALLFITSKLCQAHSPYFSKDAGETAFFLGRRFIALEIMRLISMEIKQ
jgi:hypothetical protein